MDEAAKEMSRAAKEMSEVARLLRNREEAREDFEGGLPEEAAVDLAVESAHEVRREMAGVTGFVRGEVTPAEAEEWARRREGRRRREGYRPV